MQVQPSLSVGKLEFHIIDTGCGITIDKQKKLFKPYYYDKNNKIGSAKKAYNKSLKLKNRKPRTVQAGKKLINPN